MRPIAILVTGEHGEVQRANATATGLLGPHEDLSCDALVRAEDAHGARVCQRGCDRTFTEGEQRDQGVVKVRGESCKLVCSDVNGTLVVAILPVGSAGAGADLSVRERQVLVLVARGFTSDVIGRRLGVAPSTIRTHVEHIRTKLGVHTRSQAVARALALGEIE